MCCFRSSLPGASCAADANCGSVFFLLEPQSGYLLRLYPQTEFLRVCPAFGSREQSFVPMSTIWSPPDPMTSFAVNTEPMKFICVFLSASPIPPLVIPDTRHFARLTSPIPTRSVSCFTDSAVDREFAALLKYTDKLDSFRVTLGADKRALSPPRKQIPPPSGNFGDDDEKTRGEGY